MAHIQCQPPQMGPPPEASDSLASMCWPIIQQHKPLNLMEKVALTSRVPKAEVDWPVSEPWRRELTKPRCAGQGRCQGQAQKCNSKYRYGVDDAGQCPTTVKCGVTCNPCPPPCPDPCPDQPGCHRSGRQPRNKRLRRVDSKSHRIDLYDPILAHDTRLTTRCFDWPKASRQGCIPDRPADHDNRPPRPQLNAPGGKAQACPTCKRMVVDMECGLLGYNY